MVLDAALCDSWMQHTAVPEKAGNHVYCKDDGNEDSSTLDKH